MLYFGSNVVQLLVEEMNNVIFIFSVVLFSALLVIIALLVYTFHNWQSDVFFSWSYGGGWSTVALSIIAFVLIMADR